MSASPRDDSWRSRAGSGQSQLLRHRFPPVREDDSLQFMAAHFLSRGTFTLASRRYFVIFGDIVEGTIRAGMHASAALSSSARFTAPIHAVESVDRSSGSHIGLVFAASDDEELDHWAALNFAEVVLEITENE